MFGSERNSFMREGQTQKSCSLFVSNDFNSDSHLIAQGNF